MFNHNSFFDNGKPNTYLKASLILFGVFSFLPILSLFFLPAASLCERINKAYYSGDTERAQQLSRRAGLWLMLVCIPMVLLLLFVLVAIGVMLVM